MKKYLVLFFLLASLTSFGQFSNYTNINGRYKWIAGKFDSTFTLPSGTTPSLRVGGGTGPGALFYSTTDSTVYQYTGTRWTRLRGTDTAHVVSAYVRNTTASTMTAGQVVYINGSTGTTPTIALAVNTADSTSAMTFGFVRGTIAPNAFGWITSFGPLEGVNTNAYTEGEVIYLDSIPGQFTHDKPQAPYHMVTLGYIVKKSGGNGTIFAKIQNGYELDELHNVRITEPVLNKSVIIYDSVRRLWVDTTVSAAGLGLGGSGTTNYLSKWTSSSALGNSLVQDNGTSVGIGGTPSAWGTFTNILQSGRMAFSNSLGGNAVSYLTSNIYFDGSNFRYIGTGYSFLQGYSQYDGAWYVSTYASGTAGNVLSGGANRMTIWANTGNVLIGTTTDAGYRLDVSGTFRSTGDANINGLTVGKGNNSIASNTAFGGSALSSITTGTINTAIGFTALRDNQTGFQNTAVGNAAGRANTGNNNTYFGFAAGIVNTTGGDNTIIGTYAGYALNGGSANTLLGWFVGGDIVGGGGNTIIGYNTGRGITTGSHNTIIGANVTGLSSSLSNTIILADGQGNQRLYINNSGNVGIGTTSPSNKLHVVTGNVDGIRVESSNSGYLEVGKTSGARYRWANDFSTGNTLELLYGASGAAPSTNRITVFPNGNVHFGTHIDQGYRFFVTGSISNTTGAVFAISSGNVLIGTTTDAGYKLDVNGTARVQGSSGELLLLGSTTPSGITNPVVLNLGGTYGSSAVGSRNNLKLKIYENGSSLNDTYGIGLSAGVFEIQSAGNIGFFTGASATRTERMRISDANGNVGIGTSSPNASALLDVSSNTKGFLPPRMTGANAEAIGTPAAGLLVYINNGNGTTITSTGWWGYDGTTWVKLN